MTSDKVEAVTSRAYPTVQIENGVGRYVSNIDIDLDLCSQLLASEGLTDDEIFDLVINPRVSLPEWGSLLFRSYRDRQWRESVIGAYSSLNKEVALNIPVIYHRRILQPERNRNNTLLHELGHRVDDFRGKLDYFKYPYRNLAVRLGSIASGTLAPAAAMYVGTHDLTGTALIGSTALLSSNAVDIAWSIRQSKDATIFRTRTAGEASADAFENRNKAEYPALITLEF